MRTTIAQLILLAGACLTLLAAIGMVRFHDAMTRMHALAKASTAGLVLALIGAAVGLTALNDITFVVLAAVFQIVTAPVATQLLSRATARATGSGPEGGSSPEDAPG